MHIPDAPSLAKLLPLLPNLDTLEALSGDYPEPSIEHSFQSVKLPQIRTLVMSPPVYYLVKSCTKVKRVITYQQTPSITYLESIPSIAGSLVYLALCIPAPEQIQGASVFDCYL